MTYQRTCEQCGEDFRSKREAGRFCSDRCRALQWRENGGEAGGERVLEHPLAEVREEQERAADKARWTLAVREHIARTLYETGYFHADDLDPLGIPEQHRNIAGSQSGGFVSRGLMEEVGRRASSKPSRKKAKSAIYKITAKGRQEIPALLAEKQDAGVSAGCSPKESLLGACTDPGGLLKEDDGSQESQDLGGADPPTEAVVGPPEPLSLLPETAYERLRDAA